MAKLGNHDVAHRLDPTSRRERPQTFGDDVGRLTLPVRGGATLVKLNLVYPGKGFSGLGTQSKKKGS